MGTISSVVNPLTGLYGGVNFAGNSIFQDNLSIVSNLYAGGNMSAAQLSTTQGISTNGGGIFIGDPNGITYSAGITLGCGALSGAGFGGLQAFTGDPTAIAIGNNAQALQAGSLAHGLNALADGVNATAIGTNAMAINDGATAVGSSSFAKGTNASAFGTNSLASGDNSAAFGYQASARALAPHPFYQPNRPKNHDPELLERRCVRYADGTAAAVVAGGTVEVSVSPTGLLALVRSKRAASCGGDKASSAVGRQRLSLVRSWPAGHVLPQTTFLSLWRRARKTGSGTLRDRKAFTRSVKSFIALWVAGLHSPSISWE